MMLCRIKKVNPPASSATARYFKNKKNTSLPMLFFSVSRSSSDVFACSKVLLMSDTAEPVIRGVKLLSALAQITKRMPASMRHLYFAKYFFKCQSSFTVWLNEGAKVEET